MKSKFYINFPEIYDVRGRLISPNNWALKLRGAVVRVYFTLEASKIKQKKEYYFTPRLVNMRVLKEANEIKSERTGANFTGSPVKCRRVDR